MEIKKTNIINMERISRFRCARVREVQYPTRNNKGDAGWDFYMPEDLLLSNIIQSNEKAEDIHYSNVGVTGKGFYRCIIGTNGFVKKLIIGPNTRIIIPSGIKVLLEPKASMMMAANKSGMSTKKGLIFTAEICDSPYTGEYHIGIYNTSNLSQEVEAGKPLVQFIHVPIYDDILEVINNKQFDEIAATWGTRGEKWQGSGDNKQQEVE